MPIERDNFQRHPARAFGKFLTALILGSALLVAGFIGVKYKKDSGSDKKKPDTSEVKQDLDKLYGGAEPAKTEVSQLETVKSEYTKLQFTLANGWKSKKSVDKIKGTELLVATSPDELKAVTFRFDYPQGLGGACGPVPISQQYQLLEVEPVSAESTTASDAKVYYVSGLRVDETGKTTLSAGLIGGVAGKLFETLKKGDRIPCPELYFNITNTKYLSPRDVLTPNENFSVIIGTGEGTTLAKGYDFKTEVEAKAYFESEEFQQIKQMLTSVQINL